MEKWQQDLDRYITTAPEGDVDYENWADKAYNAIPEELVNVLDTSGPYSEVDDVLDRLYQKGRSPEQASAVIVRIYGRLISKPLFKVTSLNPDASWPSHPDVRVSVDLATGTDQDSAVVSVGGRIEFAGTIEQLKNRYP